MVGIVVRRAVVADVNAVSAILTEAALWLEERGIPLWNNRDVSVEQLRGDVASGLFILGEVSGQPAGTLKYQLADPLFWPDVTHGGSLRFVHRVAVRRDYAGGTVSAALLKWALIARERSAEAYLRLDCDAARSKLRLVYERFGFRYHSDRRVGPYHVARYEYAIPERRPNKRLERTAEKRGRSAAGR